MADLVIRAEAADDVVAIATIVEAAFGQRAEATLVERIRASDRYRPDYALVADARRRRRRPRDGERRRSRRRATTAGRSSACRRSPSIRPATAGGIGSALVREVARRVDADGHPLIVLEGSPVYYARFGFEDSRPHGIRIHLPDWAPPEAGQVLRLAAYDPAITGDVVYPPAFDGLE